MKRSVHRQYIKNLFAIGITVLISLATLWFIFSTDPGVIVVGHQQDSLEHISGTKDPNSLNDAQLINSSNQLIASEPKGSKFNHSTLHSEKIEILQPVASFKNIVKILDPNGLALAGAKVESRDIDGKTILFVSISNEHGLADLAQNNNEDFMVIAFKDNYAPTGMSHVKISLFSPEKPLSLQLLLGVQAKGKVQNLKGQALPGIKVIVDTEISSSEGCAHLAANLLSSISDDNGDFIIHHAPNGKNTFKGQSDVWITLEPASVELPQSEPIIVFMDSGRPITLQILDESGKGIPQAQFVCEYSYKSSKQSDFSLMSGVSDRSGNCQWLAPQKGWLFLTISHADHLRAEMDGVSLLDQQNLTIVLAKGIDFKGRVIDNTTEEGINKAKISFQGIYNGKNYWANVESDLKGEFYFKSLPTEGLSLKLEAQGYISAEIAPFKFDPQTTSPYSIRMSKGEGCFIQLVNTDRKPIQNCEIEVAIKENGTFNPFEQLWKGLSNNDGEIFVTGFAAGNYRFKVSSKEYSPAEIELGSDQKKLQLVLQKSCSINLKLKINGELPPRIAVHQPNYYESQTESIDKAEPLEVLLDPSEKIYKIQNLSVGKFEFVVKALNFITSDTQVLELTEGQTLEYSMDLRPGGFIDLKLMCPDGKFFKQSLTWVLQGQYNLFRQGQLDKPDENGIFRIAENPQNFEKISIFPLRHQALKNIVLDELGFREQKEIVRATLFLKKGASFSALIKNSLGESIAGAKLVLRPMPNSKLIDDEMIRDVSMNAYGESDREGKLTLSGLELGSYIINIVHDDYLQQSMPLDLGLDPTADLNIVLLSGKSIRVGVKNEAGEFLPNIALNVQNDITNIQNSDFSYYEQHISGKDGTCLFSRLQVGHYLLSLQENVKGWAEKISFEIAEQAAPQDTLWLILKKGEAIGGQVLDENLNPVAKLVLSMVKITPHDNDYLYYELVTQSDGKFSHDSIQPGEYDISLNGTLYQWLTPSAQRKVKSGQTQLELRVKMTPTIKGHVTTQDGEVVLNYTLVLKDSDWGGLSEAAMVKIDKKGHFEMPVLYDPQHPHREIILLAKSPRHGLSQEISFNTQSVPQDPLVFVIQKKACLVVDLVDEKQRVLSGLEAWCYSSLQAKSITNTMPIISNEQGRLFFPIDNDDPLTIRIFGGGKFFCDKVITLQALGHDESNPYVVVMSAGGKITGKLIDSNGDSVSNYIVEIQLKDSSIQPQFIRNTMVNSDGSFSFITLAAGIYGLSAKQEGAEHNSQELKEISLLEGEEAKVELMIPIDPNAGSVFGLIKGLSPKDNVWGIQLSSLDKRSVKNFSLVHSIESNYKFSFSMVPAGKYVLSVQGERLSISKTIDLQAAQNLEIELELMDSMVNAEVVDFNGQSLEYGTAIIFPLGGLKNNQYSTLLNPPSGIINKGKLSLKGISPGQYDVLFLAHHARSLPPYLLRNINVLENGADLGVVTIPEGKSMLLKIQNYAGDAVAGARAEIVLWQGEVLPSFSIRSQSNIKGQLEICIPIDTAEITFSAPNTSSLQLTLEKIGKTVVLPSGGTVVVSLQGKDVAGWRLEMRNSLTLQALPPALDLDPFLFVADPITISNSQGKASFYHVKPSSWVILASKNGREVWSEAFLVPDGQSKEISLECPP